MDKEMREGSEDTIFLDSKIVNPTIEKDGQYKENDILIKKWDDNSETNNYITEMNKSGSKFIGILNEKFDRDGYGAYYFPNGDKYFGNFKEDKRNFNGIYIWSPIQKGTNFLTESFYGYWENNKKSRSGIYMWLNEPEKNEEFEKADFEAYVGELENSTYKRGTYMKKEKDSYHVYHGNFDIDGKKNDNDGYFYSADLDRLFHGKIIKDKFISGYISYFDQEGMISDIVQCEFDDNSVVNKLVMKKDLQSLEKENEEKKCALFRNIILGENYFEEIYSKYKEITKFIKNNMNSVEIFKDKDKFPTIMKLASAYNNTNIYNDIELKAFDRRIE